MKTSIPQAILDHRGGHFTPHTLRLDPILIDERVERAPPDRQAQRLDLGPLKAYKLKRILDFT